MNRSLLFPALSAALAVSLLFLPGCKSTDKKKDETPGAETDKDRAKRTAAEAPFYAECVNLGERGGSVQGKDGWLFSAAELLQLGRISSTRTAVGSIADYAQ